MQQKTIYHIILDQSGSMQDCLASTISGYNEQLQVIRSLQQRFPDQEIRVGLTRFNYEIMHSYFSLHPAKAVELNSRVYQPNGTTALYDAIGFTVKEILQQHTLDITAGLATVVVVVITDGHENASNHYSHAKIKGLISELESTTKWTFSYLGSTPDAVEIAQDLNFQKNNSMHFEKENMKHTFSKLGKSMNTYMSIRTEGKNPTDFLNPED